ncbi:hypothetical protein GSI_05709 [Ganoderma sinense ZZ0214-1]|uniref:ubiquitinyl hydrolase 1 n=1 Tax=Ganoderma sinense ZZ0214-1 TaxID=1077348 RepID=A0A2G8SB75_9APHY|nr:hypothetical protein GSI_05709 [Ganoderma sinense ZZ0214-1]
MTQDLPSSSRLPQKSSDSNNRPRSHPNSQAIDPATFYGSSASNLGSATTSYIPPESTSFRQPELVEEEPIPKHTATWDPESTTWGGEPSDGWGNLDTLGPWGDPPVVSVKVAIDGRDDYEETHWYDPDVRAIYTRPGTGVLPPLLADMLHDPDHALYSVSTQVHPTLVSPAAPFTPTADEVRTAIPHPNAYFCREHNGWVLLLWKASTVLPPLVKEPETPVPDQSRRKRTNSCVGDGEQIFGQANLTHHWHRYEKAVDATKLNPPYAHGELLLDLYLCCQCSMYCLVSDVIPGVIPVSLVNEFTLDKIGHPAIDKTPKATAVSGWETVLTIIDNRLWRDEQRSLPVGRSRFRAKLGWNDHVERVFAALGFPLDKLNQPDGKPDELALQPPPVDPSTAEGKASRTKLLRAWVEVSAWLAIYEKANKDGLKDYNTMVIHVKADSERDLYQTGIGAHVSQISRGSLPEHVIAEAQSDPSWKALGMTPSTYSWELLVFAYLAQCRCDPANTMVYFTHLVTIVDSLINWRAGEPDQLQAFIVQEKERYRFTLKEHDDYARRLGFGRNNDLGVELDSDVDDEFIAQAWRSARQRAWMSPGDASRRRAGLNDALKVVAEQRGSTALIKVWMEEKGSGMSPETAYSTLDVPRDVDETMLLTVYSMRIEDQPSQADRMREALNIIAEVTNSERLRQFLATGRDPGDTNILNTSPEMPRGLNQLGNTCYLNSLLQYFYTIKDLRVAIASLATADAKFLDDSKFTDDDLKRHRVGGRLVTRREILRSKKFVNLLSELFWNMEFCETAAVTPAIELAKLALVTSQDEEEDETDKAGTDSSNDTDATLVDDMAPRPVFDRSSPPVAPVQSPKSPTGSVLGKRARDGDGDADGELPMDIDSSPAHSPPGPSVASPPSTKASGSSGSGRASEDPMSFIEDAIGSSSKRPAAGNGDGDADPDVEMKDGSPPSQAAGKVPPPLPPRKRQAADSVMMFGRQHDVSECMDNCMFQIETALLDFQGMAASDDDKTSPIKRLFYGKKRQRLVSLSPNDDARHQSSIHEKEDLFSQVHVNVAEEGFDLYDGLARYFDDVVEIGGQKKQMEVSIVDPPPLLQVQLQRVQFNRETQQAYKSQAYVKFGETLYMDRFLDSADPGKKARSKAIQTELTIARERHAPFAPAFANTAEYLTKQGVLDLALDDANSFALSLAREESLITEQLRAERERTAALKAQMEEIWRDEAAAAYELTSVFIHRGSSPSWGHYFFYSRNLPGRPDEWFKYNDSDVSAVSKDEVLADTTGSTANPYMLVFVRKGYDAIDTVHRFNPDSLQEAE